MKTITKLQKELTKLEIELKEVRAFYHDIPMISKPSEISLLEYKVDKLRESISLKNGTLEY